MKPKKWGNKSVFGKQGTSSIKETNDPGGPEKQENLNDLKNHKTKSKASMWNQETSWIIESNEQRLGKLQN